MGVPLVLLPGSLCDTRIFEPQIRAFGADRPVMFAPVTADSRTETIAASLLPQLPLRFALAGHDFGGAVAMELLRLAPERVDRLCLMSTTALAETPAQAAAREPWIVRAQAGRLEDVLQEVIPADHFAQGSGRTDIVNLMRQMARDLGPEVFVRQMRASQRRRDYQATLRRCKAPTLILCGAEDPLTPPKRHAFMAELIAGARLEIIEGTGHAPTLETPERVTALWRDWLDAPFLLN